MLSRSVDARIEHFVYGERVAKHGDMDWFETLTGFREQSYQSTRERLEVVGNRLRSKVNDRSWLIGRLELLSLATLRERVARNPVAHRQSTVRLVTGNVRLMHRDPQYAGAIFQVASQFNLLEMISPAVTPEHGVGRYDGDPTQGPACAIAAGAATIYRNYFVPVAGGVGQAAERQLDGLADVGDRLSDALRVPLDSLWTMKNGYALCRRSGLEAIGRLLEVLSSEDRDAIAAQLMIGIHQDVEVTDGSETPGQLLSQAFCSALPVAYCDHSTELWRPFATLVLEAAYEATLLAAACKARTGGSNIVLLTFLGGGAFGNHPDWIYGAMRSALARTAKFGLDVRLVSFGAPPELACRLVEEFS